MCIRDRSYDDWEPSVPQFEYDPYDADSLETSLEDWETYAPSGTSNSNHWVPVAAIGTTALTSALLLVVMRGLRIR